jgi:hypothetical protein
MIWLNLINLYNFNNTNKKNTYNKETTKIKDKKNQFELL